MQILVLVALLFSFVCKIEACDQTLACLSPQSFADESTEAFDPSLLYLLDQNGGTYFFRGNLPQIDDEFCYGPLLSAMNTELAKINKSLSHNVQLLDLSLLNYGSETPLIEVEQDWLSANADLGHFWLNSLFGARFNPCDLPQWLRNFILKHSDVDGLKMLTAKLKAIMVEPHATDYVIYMHCNAGKDRTGEAAACYLMQYFGYSFDQAMQLDVQIAGRELMHHSQYAICWYAFYLRDILNMSSIGLINGK